MKHFKWIFCALVCLLATLAGAQPASPSLRVATRLISPFVLQTNGRFSGFSIDLWSAISSKMGAKTTYVVRPTVVDLLAAVKTRQADVGIAAISINAARDKDFDFSQPMFDSGLQILVRNTESGSSIGRLWEQVVSSGIFRWLAAIFLLGLLPANIVWAVERKHPRGILTYKSYIPGVFEAYWWSLSCLATQAEEMPKSVLGRMVAIFWMFTAVVFLAFFTAQVTASLTVQELHGAIKGPDDLPGKKVATTTGSTSAAYLRSHNVNVVEVPRIDAAYEALDKGDADAVVFDSPVLQYYVAHEGNGKFRTVGEMFQKEYYGIVFLPNSPYRKPIEGALLSMKEDGSYQELYDKWFASK